MPIFEKILPNVYFNFKDYLRTLKILTVLKKYELQKYIETLYKFRENKDFANIFSDDENCKYFFLKEKEEKYKEIFDYENFKKHKNEIKNFVDNYDNDKNDMHEEEKYFNEKNEVLDSEDEKENEIKKEIKVEKKIKEEKPESKKVQTILNSKEFRQLKEKDKIIKEEFHGSRDFYYLIKGIANELNENTNNDLKSIVKKNIERNFGGLEITIDFEEDYGNIEEMEQYNKVTFNRFLNEIKKKKKWSSVQIFKIIYNLYCIDNDESENILLEEEINEYNYIENIIGNIKDKRSRYLLLEIKPSLASLIHKKLEKELGKEIYFFEGSPFENDNSNEYQSKIINQIQEHAEDDHANCVILQNLKQVYPFFYDVFNKNFIIKEGKYYARVCHGNFSDQLIQIDEGFKIIIFVNKKYMDKVEPPFLNRFDKMNLYFKEMLKDNNPKKLAKLIFDKIDMKKIQKRLAYNINYELEDLLIGCRLEDILGMIY